MFQPKEIRLFSVADATYDAWLHFSRFLECLCLDDGAALFGEDVADAAHWHRTMLGGQYR